jgi:hypothetical protein
MITQVMHTSQSSWLAARREKLISLSFTNLNNIRLSDVSYIHP